MIELKKGDILKADAEALVNTVNCVGIMGRGIALQFRTAFPENYKEYQKTCTKFKRVSSLIEGFETPYGMELLSTVHWVATCENARRRCGTCLCVG